MAPAFLFIGPAPFINMGTNTGLIQGMLGLGGIGYAFVVISTFSRAQSEALRKGLPDDIETYLMISGNHQYNKRLQLYEHIVLTKVYLTKIYT